MPTNIESELSLPTITTLSQEQITGLVLIVDDTPTNLEVISEALADAGFDVAIATSGKRALRQLERRLPDLILLDVMMPGIDGFETCRAIKENPRTAKIPIIFMTALTDAESKVKALGLGAVDYITKPFHEAEVLARVRTHLHLHYLNQNLAAQVAKKTAELEASQLQLIQHEKMSALGNLVSGVAHEINNPLGCIIGNVPLLQNSLDDLFGLINLYQEQFPEPGDEINEEVENIDLEYLREDLPKLVQSMADSGDRIQDISQSLRIFSRADTDKPQLANVHECLDSTVMILQHRLKPNDRRPLIKVVRDYGALPVIRCFPGQLNQVFMNLLANAIDALDEAAQYVSASELAANPQTITIKTALVSEAEFVEIGIQDNGQGIAELIKTKIFEHLFTTKDVGQGTGLGLAIARQIVVEKHGGSLTVESKQGEGSCFYIHLPINAPSPTADHV